MEELLGKAVLIWDGCIESITYDGRSGSMSIKSKAIHESLAPIGYRRNEMFKLTKAMHKSKILHSLTTERDEYESLVDYGFLEYVKERAKLEKVKSDIKLKDLLKQEKLNATAEKINAKLEKLNSTVENNKFYVNRKTGEIIALTEFYTISTMHEDIILAENFQGISRTEVLQTLPKLEIIYDPTMERTISENLNDSYERVSMLNDYIPPYWKSNPDRLDIKPKVPPLVLAYFLAFFDHDYPTIAVCLSWSSMTLKTLTQTYLSIVGARGGGKTLFAFILSSYCGEMNSSKLESQAMSSRFTGSMYKKTFCNLDEPVYESRTASDYMKDKTNERISIEQKGKDAITVKNFCSFLLTSNQNKSIVIEGDERKAIVPIVRKDDIQREINKPYLDKLSNKISDRTDIDMCNFYCWLESHCKLDSFRPSTHVILEGQVRQYMLALSEWQIDLLKFVYDEICQGVKLFLLSELKDVARKGKGAAKIKSITVQEFLIRHRVYRDGFEKFAPYSYLRPVILGTIDHTNNSFNIEEETYEILRKRYAKYVRDKNSIVEVDEDDKGFDLSYDPKLHISPESQMERNWYYMKWMKNMIDFVDRENEDFHIIEKFLESFYDGYEKMEKQMKSLPVKQEQKGKYGF